MSKMTCVILGLSLSAIGIMGLIDYTLYMQYINYGAIALGIIGLLVGIYAKQGTSDQRLKTETATQKKDIDHQRREIEQQNKQIELHKKDAEALNKEIETRNKGNEVLKKEIEALKKEIDEQKNMIKELKTSAKN